MDASPFLCSISKVHFNSFYSGFFSVFSSTVIKIPGTLFVRFDKLIRILFIILTQNMSVCIIVIVIALFYALMEEKWN